MTAYIKIAALLPLSCSASAYLTHVCRIVGRSAPGLGTVVCLVILLCSAHLVNAQNIIIPEGISIRDGLSQGYIACMIQDSEGFLWIGTKNGLNRYDGRQFEIFTHDPLDPYSISDDWTYSLLEHGDYLLVAGMTGDLDIYSKRTKRFYNVPEVDEIFAKSNSSPEIMRDSTGQFWIFSTEMQKVVRLRLPDQLWESESQLEKLSEQIEIDTVELAGSPKLSWMIHEQNLLGFSLDNEPYILDILAEQICKA